MSRQRRHFLPRRAKTGTRQDDRDLFRQCLLDAVGCVFYNKTYHEHNEERYVYKSDTSLAGEEGEDNAVHDNCL